MKKTLDYILLDSNETFISGQENLLIVITKILKNVIMKN